MISRFVSWLSDETRSMLENRGDLALRAAIATAAPVAVGALLGDVHLGLLTFIGTFCVQYGAGQAGRIRLLIQTWTVSCLLICTTMGILAGHNLLLSVIFQVITAVIAVYVVTVMRIGPPGGVFMVLAIGISNQLTVNGTNPVFLLVMTLIGGIFGAFLALVDIFWGSHKAEEQALRRAENAVRRFERYPRYRGGTAVQANAAESLYDAWTIITDALPVEATPNEDAEADKLRDIHIRYLARSAEMAAMELPEEISHKVSPSYTARQADVQSRRLRDLSLGRPTPGRLIAASLDWPSEPLLISIRVGIGTTLAAILSLGFGFSRAYWAIAFTVVLLNSGGTRAEQANKALQRIVGTVIGIGLFWGISHLPLSPVWLVGWLFVTRYVGTLFIRRAYHVAMTFITAMALLGVSASTQDLSARAIQGLILERSADDVIAAFASMGVILVAFRGHEILFIRGYARRTLYALMAVLDDLALERTNTITAFQHRRVLYTELIANEEVARRTSRDDPNGAGRYRGMSLELRALGYLVLGACWHPELITHTNRYKEAGRYLGYITEQPFQYPRSPEEITLNILDAHLAVITDEEQFTPFEAMQIALDENLPVEMRDNSERSDHESDTH
ncbi:FUSC family protein [Stomatohabitans albus]|uniref:FUSC family protein n=1 Tax=Stomatohabitans albus TaxID=3110766 RepID=UPI00300C82CB